MNRTRVHPWSHVSLRLSIKLIRGQTLWNVHSSRELGHNDRIPVSPSKYQKQGSVNGELLWPDQFEKFHKGICASSVRDEPKLALLIWVFLFKAMYLSPSVYIPLAINPRANIIIKKNHGNDIQNFGYLPKLKKRLLWYILTVLMAHVFV